MALEQGEAPYLGPFPVVVKIEGKDLRTEKGTEGWAGWIPRSEVEGSKFQELVLCPRGDRTEIWKDVLDGLTALQDRLEKAAAETKVLRLPFGTRTRSLCRTRSGS